MRLKDKIVIITGGAAGIGKKTAELFAHEGAKVVIADYDRKAGEKTASSIEGIEYIFVDVADFDSAESLIVETVKKYGRLDILINNAGITADGWLVKMKEKDWDRVIDVNLKGVF
ncbi:MAG: SDR family NAD(P)-dependent oxidoreductase, partial [Halanaerobiales bacterium]